MSNVGREVCFIVNTSVQDGLMSAKHANVISIRRAIEAEQRRETTRVSLIRGLKAELRKRERAEAAPKDAA